MIAENGTPCELTEDEAENVLRLLSHAVAHKHTLEEMIAMITGCVIVGQIGPDQMVLIEHCADILKAEGLLEWGGDDLCAWIIADTERNLKYKMKERREAAAEQILDLVGKLYKKDVTGCDTCPDKGSCPDAEPSL